MAITHKKVAKRDLNSFRVYREDTDPNSLFFRVSQFPAVLTAGKNVFLIEGTAALHPETEVLVEIIDSLGNTIYCQPIKNYIEGISRLVTIEIYEDTPPGPATITIMGELRTDENGNSIPPEWVDTYNVKWQSTVVVIPSQINDTKIRLKDVPQVSVREILYPYLEQQNNITRSPELLSNGNPSENLNGWSVSATSASVSLDDSYVSFGKKSVKISSTFDNSITVRIDNVDGNTGIPVYSGTEYVCEVYLYIEQSLSLPVYLSFIYYKDSVSNGQAHASRTQLFNTTQGWNKFVITDVIPPGINLMRLSIDWSQYPVNTIWINNVKLYYTNNQSFQEIEGMSSQQYKNEKVISEYLIKSKQPFFSSSMVGGIINSLIDLNQFTSSIVEVVSDTIAKINPPYTSSDGRLSSFTIPYNYITDLLYINSNQTDFAYREWIKGDSLSVDKNVLAPDNASPSIRLSVPPGGGLVHGISTFYSLYKGTNKPQKTPIAASIYIKPDQIKKIALGYSYNTGSFYLNTYLVLISGSIASSSVSNAAYIVADLDTKEIKYSGSLTTGDTFTSTEIISLSDGWYRICFGLYIEEEVSASLFTVTPTDNNYSANNYGENSGSGFWMWGAQLEYSNKAGMYNTRRNNIEYNFIPSTTNTSFTRSLAEISLNKLETVSGEISRAKIFVKNYDLQDSYQLIDDIKLSSTELLVSDEKSDILINRVYIGSFTTQSVLLNHWNDGIIIDDQYCPISISTSSIDNSKLINGISINHVPSNLFSPYERAFESISVWTTESVFIVTNPTSSKFIDPIGGYSSRKLVATTSSFTHDLLQRAHPLNSASNFITTCPTGSYIYTSLYLKKDKNLNAAYFCLDNNSIEYFGIQIFFDENKLMPISQSTASTIIDYGFEKQSYDWYKLWMIGRPHVTCSSPRLEIALFTGSSTSWSWNFSGDNNSGIYLWDVALYATASNKILNTYFGENSPSSLNKISQPSIFKSSSFWTTTSVIVGSSSAFAPDGTITAQRIIETVSAPYHFVQNKSAINILPNSVHRISAYVSQSGRFNGLLYALNNTSSAPSEDNRFGISFNLQSSSFNSYSIDSGSVLDCGMKNIGNGWYNVWAIGELSPLSSSLYIHLRMLDNFENAQYTGSNDVGMYWWGTSVTTIDSEQDGFSSDAEYTLTYDLYCDATSSFLPTSTSVSVYLSGSAFQNSSSLGRLIDYVTLSPKQLPMRYRQRSVNFTPTTEGTGYINFVISGNSKNHISNISIKSATEFGFNPETVKIFTSIINRRYQHLKFKVELYDNNNNIVPVVLETDPISFDGGNYAILGTDNRIFGTLIASPSGNGIVLGSNQAGSFAGALSKIGNVNSPPLPQPINPADLNTYSGSMIITIYSGSSPFIGTRDATGSFGLQIYFSSSSFISIDSSTGIKIMGATITSSSII